MILIRSFFFRNFFTWKILIQFSNVADMLLNEGQSILDEETSLLISESTSIKSSCWNLLKLNKHCLIKSMTAIHLHHMPYNVHIDTWQEKCATRWTKIIQNKMELSTVNTEKCDTHLLRTTMNRLETIFFHFCHKRCE